MASLDQLNFKMSVCGFTLYKDAENNFIFRVSYSGCLVQQQDEYSILTLNLIKRIGRFGGRSHSLAMKCPVFSIPNREHIQCDPENIQVLENDSEFLPLKLVSGQYAYSMEATCPKVPEAAAEEIVLHIYKRRMGLTKRGSPVTESLTVSNMSVKQTDNFTLHETSQFVTIIVPTAKILQQKSCPDNKLIWQPVLRVDVLLTFKETNHSMHWSMENTLA